MPATLGPVDADRNKAKDFARVFCSTLPHLRDEKNHRWGECSLYLETSEPVQPLAELTTGYRFLLVGGFGTDCLRGTRVFSTAIEHLSTAHKITVEYFPVAPFGSSEDNGGAIARQIERGWAVDSKRKYVLVGYDKGTADLLSALRALSMPATKVAALVSVAGTVGGSWVTESYRTLMKPGEPWMDPGCPGNQADGLFDLSRDVRQKFLRENPFPVAGYSIVASSDPDTTSKVLRDSWNQLTAYAVEQDGLLVAWESMLPGARYLGTARADHWAIALPFDSAPTGFKKIDKNKFPRDALLESIVRFVSADLDATAQKTGTP